MLDFQRYQAEFTAHIRNPKLHKKPANVNTARMAVYQNAVFNNIADSVSVCFPVCQSVFGKRVWDKILQDFVASFAAASPIFREIPQQFLQFLSTKNQNTKNELPAYLQPLAHYEWAELAVSHLPASNVALNKNTDLLKQTPVLAPHLLLEYDFAVHQISAKFKPKQPEKTYLLVYRNAAFEVKFIALNPMTYQLLKLIEENELTGEQALMRLAEQMQHPDANAVIQFGLGILTDLAKQQAIVGSFKLAKL